MWSCQRGKDDLTEEALQEEVVVVVGLELVVVVVPLEGGEAPAMTTTDCRADLGERLELILFQQH